MMGFVLASHMSFAENIEVTPIQQVTSQELAAIYVLSEVCEKFITDEVKFEAGYRKLVQEYLPTERDAVTTLKKMSLEQSFQAILLEAKNDAIAAGDTKNQEICLELSAYSN
jgi:hypothetical protein